MRTFAFDTETYLIGPSTTAPPLVCLTYAMAEEEVTSADAAELCKRVRSGEVKASSLLAAVDSEHRISWGLLPPEEGLDLLAHALGRPDTVVVGHNAPFDLWVCGEESPEVAKLVVAGLESGRVKDTQVRDQMVDIATGQFRSREEVDPETGEVKFVSVGYHLTDLTDRRLGFKLEKGEDSWRLRYAELAATPVKDWPYEAVQYAVLDALSTLAVYLSQREQWSDIPDELRQTRAAWALAGIAGRGLCVDPEPVEALNTAITADVIATRAELTREGIYRPDGTKDTKRLRELVEAAYGAQGATLQRTAGGEVATSRQVLLDSGDATLRKLAEVGARERVLTGFIPVLRRGYHSPVVCRYHTLVETGRTSCVDPNIQQLPRYPGVRDAFIPRPGFYFVSVDYDTLELRTLAQVCLDLVGWSTMADLLVADPNYDLHSDFAASFERIDYPEFMARLKSGDDKIKAAAKDARQRAKAANFGYPGGLGAEKFKQYAKVTYQLDLDLSECKRLQTQWKKRWPEVVEFQAMISGALDPVSGRADFPLVRTGFVRGDCRYTQGCNTQFQGLAAAGAKEALWRAMRDGPSHGVFPVAFLHDEIIAEVPIDSATESANWLANTMCEAMATVVPDVPITASPALMRRWYKKAEPKYDAQGKLVPWEPGK